MIAVLEGVKLDKEIIKIKKTLNQSMDISILEVEDQGHLHQGHKAAVEGKLHLKMIIVSDEFINLNPVERHQNIYSILADFLAGRLHALSLETYTTKEYDNLSEI